MRGKREGGGSLVKGKREGGGSLVRGKREGGGSLVRGKREGGGSLVRGKREGGGSLVKGKREGGGSSRLFLYALLHITAASHSPLSVLYRCVGLPCLLLLHRHSPQCDRLFAGHTQRAQARRLLDQFW